MSEHTNTDDDVNDVMDTNANCVVNEDITTMRITDDDKNGNVDGDTAPSIATSTDNDISDDIATSTTTGTDSDTGDIAPSMVASADNNINNNIATSTDNDIVPNMTTNADGNVDNGVTTSTSGVAVWWADDAGGQLRKRFKSGRLQHKLRRGCEAWTRTRVGHERWMSEVSATHDKRRLEVIATCSGRNQQPTTTTTTTDNTHRSTVPLSPDTEACHSEERWETPRKPARTPITTMTLRTTTTTRNMNDTRTIGEIGERTLSEVGTARSKAWVGLRSTRRVTLTPWLRRR